MYSESSDPLAILTDSGSLFRESVKASVTTEYHLMMHIRAAREAYEIGDISDVGWIRSPSHLTDGLTKFVSGKTFNMTFLYCVKLNV